MLLMLLLQVATSPDIQLQAKVQAKSVKVEQKGSASVKVHADPDGGSAVAVDAPHGSSTYRNVSISIDAKAVVAPDGATAGSPAAPDQSKSQQGE